MLVQRLILKNWRNFRQADVPLRDATGKSNLLDVFRFLRDVCKAKGGGLQTAVAERGGIAKLRCLHARRDPEVDSSDASPVAARRQTPAPSRS
jgi:predicted ATPase